MKRFFAFLLAAVLVLTVLPLVGAAQPTVVYVNGTKSSSGDGSSAETAVRTLREAYSLLSRTAGGTIVVCGRTEASDWSQELEKNPFTAAVTLTSRYGAENYADAALIFTDRYFCFGGKTVLTDLLLQTSINTYLYSGADLTVKRSVRTSMTDTDAKLSIYCGLRTARCESVRVDLAGGTFTQILLSTTKGTGTTEARLSGDVYINSNVTLGASGTADLIRLTMDGGSVDKLYATPRSGGTTKAAELILRGGQFESFTDAPTLKKTTTLGELTVTLGSEFICDNLGAWEDSKLNLNGTRSLNWLNYAGGTLKGLDRYDRVNLLGGDTIPSAKEGSYMRLYGYSGQFSADPSGFPTLYVDGGSEATLLRTLPSETALSVDADSTLRLASPWNEEGRTEAALVQPELTAVSPVLRVDFEQSTDDRSGSGIHLLDGNGRVLPELYDIFKVVAEHDLVLASGHYPYAETSIVFEAAKKAGVKHLEVVHPAHIHSKTTIAQMKEYASENVMLMLSGLGTLCFPLHETGPIYAARMIQEVGADHFVYGSDFGQIHNPPHIVGHRWMIQMLLAYGVSKEEITKIFKTNPARHIGLE